MPIGKALKVFVQVYSYRVFLTVEVLVWESLVSSGCPFDLHKVSRA